MFRSGVKLSSIDSKIRAQLDMLLNFYRVAMDATILLKFEEQLALGRQHAEYPLEEAVEAEAETYLNQHPDASPVVAIDAVMQDEAVLERLAPRFKLQGDEMKAEIKANIAEVHNGIEKLNREMQSISNKIDEIREQFGEQGFTYDPQNKQQALLGTGAFGE
eukprot:6175339-Pleurochrysis_carterae.AAC.1